jgi:hypothetical protein
VRRVACLMMHAFLCVGPQNPCCHAVSVVQWCKRASANIYKWRPGPSVSWQRRRAPQEMGRAQQDASFQGARGKIHTDKSHGDGVASFPLNQSVAGGPQDTKKRRRLQQANPKSPTAVAADGKQPTQAVAKVARNDSAKDVASLGTRDGERERHCEQSSDALTASASANDSAKGHDKYCHFCQHVKINMLACTSSGCTHRYTR